MSQIKNDYINDYINEGVFNTIEALIFLFDPFKVLRTEIKK